MLVTATGTDDLEVGASPVGLHGNRGGRTDKPRPEIAPDIGIITDLAWPGSGSTVGLKPDAIASSPEVIMNRRAQNVTLIAVAAGLLLPRRFSPYPGGGCPESWAVPGTRACGRSARQIFMRKTPAGMYQCGPAMP
jgi:hypothetical protein